MKPSTWFRLEDGVLNEMADYKDDLEKKVEDVDPLTGRPYCEELAKICHDNDRDFSNTIRLIQFYMSRCHIVHSGLKLMMTQQKVEKVKSDLAAIRSLPHRLSQYETVITNAILGYAVANSISIDSTT
jgi:hypothetical protein